MIIICCFYWERKIGWISVEKETAGRLKGSKGWPLPKKPFEATLCVVANTSSFVASVMFSISKV